MPKKKDKSKPLLYINQPDFQIKDARMQSRYSIYPADEFLLKELVEKALEKKEKNKKNNNDRKPSLNKNSKLIKPKKNETKDQKKDEVISENKLLPDASAEFQYPILSTTANELMMIEELHQEKEVILLPSDKNKIDLIGKENNHIDAQNSIFQDQVKEDNKRRGHKPADPSFEDLSIEDALATLVKKVMDYVRKDISSVIVESENQENTNEKEHLIKEADSVQKWMNRQTKSKLTSKGKEKKYFEIEKSGSVNIEKSADGNLLQKPIGLEVGIEIATSDLLETRELEFSKVEMPQLENEDQEIQDQEPHEHHEAEQVFQVPSIQLEIEAKPDLEAPTVIEESESISEEEKMKRRKIWEMVTRMAHYPSVLEKPYCEISIQNTTIIVQIESKRGNLVKVRNGRKLHSIKLDEIEEIRIIDKRKK